MKASQQFFQAIFVLDGNEANKIKKEKRTPQQEKHQQKKIKAEVQARAGTKQHINKIEKRLFELKI